MSPAFIFTAALLCGIIIGLLTPMVVAYLRTVRVAVYRKDRYGQAIVPMKYHEELHVGHSSEHDDRDDLIDTLFGPAPVKDW